MLRVGHYLNQFFAGIGGEEQAHTPPSVRAGPIGPGRLLNTLLGPEGAVASTLVCGDNFFNEQFEASAEAVRGWLRDVRPDMVVAGPAFAAGRYGRACAEVCRVCEKDCRSFRDDRTMQACADACRTCAESCEGMAA